ncbi:hypothetical protein [Thermomonas sp.]|uniref:hypothetical protein n=1 Tax=Thermomonas sp. TaxID=1971895 RepID=UPI002600649D|nr:hypothetical protein [Thermomonas sp.]
MWTSPSLVEGVFNAPALVRGAVLVPAAGPFGAVRYRLSVLAVERDDRNSRRKPPPARAWLALLEWPVAQLMTTGLALVGNFDSVMATAARGRRIRPAWRPGSAAARASVRQRDRRRSRHYAESRVSASTAIIGVRRTSGTARRDEPRRGGS